MLELRMLGRLECRETTGEAVEPVFVQPRAAALLVYLASVHDGSFVRRATLLPLFWPELNEASARHALSQVVYRLRQTLRKERIETRGDESLRLSMEGCWVDVHAFEARLAADDVEGALDLYVGEFLPGFSSKDAGGFERWLEEERERLRRAGARAAWSAAERLLQRGDTAQAESVALRALDLDPANEDAARRVLSGLVRMGAGARAVRFYGALRRQLEREYGLAPSKETRALVSGLLESAVESLETIAGMRDAESVARPQGAEPGKGPASTPGAHGKPFRAVPWLVGALALLAGLGLLSSRVARPRESLGPVVVVSAFIDRTGDPSLDFVAEGLRLALAGELAQSARVRLRTDPVPSRTVDYVVEGAVFAVGDSLRVQVTVTDANAGTLRLAKNLTYPRRELPALPLGLTTEIVRALDLSMSPRGERRVGRHASRDTAAYSQWLRALALESRRQRDALLGCVEATDSAVANDPMFAEAFALRARCLNVLSFVDTVAPERSFGLAKQSAARALAIDPGLARAHAELAYAVAHHDWDWEEAERQYARALQLDGATPQMHADLAWVLSWRRRFDEAFRHMTQAEALAPDDPQILLRMSMILHFAGRHQEAANLAYRVIAMDSSSLFAWDRLHWAYQGLGRLDSAVVAAERASAIGGPADVRRRGFLGYAYARHGRRDEAQAILRELAERAGDAPVPPTAIAAVHVGLGEHEEAIRLLERGYRTRDGDMVVIATFVPWRALARHPRFQRLVAGMRLPQRRDD